jgi:LacI family repressor for deo operon, udp, cdd, tsx, nupC, and nupG
VSISLAVPSSWSRRLRERGGLWISVDRVVEDWPSCAIDNVRGGELAGAYLVGLGHRRVGFVGDRPPPGLGFASSAEREEGVRRALGQHGLALHGSDCLHPPFGVDEAARGVRQLLERADPRSAVAVASDVQAMGVLRAAAELGVRVPTELSIIGFDDIELAGAIGLTTVHQPLESSGRWAAGVLAEWLGGKDPAPATTWLPLKIVERSTTAPPGGWRADEDRRDQDRTRAREEVGKA